MITGRRLQREEIGLIWGIDRSEVIENSYRVVNGALVLEPDLSVVTGWPPGEAEQYTPILVRCFARGGWIYGLFDDAKLIAAVVLDAEFIGRCKDQLQLIFLHVDRAYRGHGFGGRLFGLAKVEAGGRGATRLYISATPTENTIDFYRRLGCVMNREPDPQRFALEPEDVHLECDL